MGDEEKQKTNGDEESSVNNPLSNQDKSENNKKKFDNESQPTKKEGNKMPPFWRKLGIAEVTNIILAVSAIVSLILVYCMTSEQNQLSREALKRADSTIALTKQSILSSDSTTRQALRISDSSLRIASENLKVIRERNQIELRAYLQMTSFELAQFNVGEKIIIKVHLENVGKTVARIIEGKSVMKFGGTGIYPADFENSEISKDSTSKIF